MRHERTVESMNRKIPFEQNELRAVEMIPGMFGRAPTPLRNTPVSPKENYAALYYDKAPYWIPLPVENAMFSTQLYGSRLSRGVPGTGTTDAFGIEWEYVPTAGGSMVRPGAPFMADANEWKDKIKFPNIDEWDWAAELENVTLNPRLSIQTSLVNGYWFERLVSFMDFGPAVMALIDEDQKDAVKSLFEAMTEFAMKVVDKFIEYWPEMDGFNVHDDWAAQKAPFFSKQTGYEMFVPYMRMLTDHIHSKGRYATLHSCGHGAMNVECFIDGGFDRWDPQTMNDTYKLYDEFGDKIVIAVVPEPFDPETTSEAEQRERARAFVDRFTQPGKPCCIGSYGNPALTPAFSDELYEYSRKKYAGLL